MRSLMLVEQTRRKTIWGGFTCYTSISRTDASSRLRPVFDYQTYERSTSSSLFFFRLLDGLTYSEWSFLAESSLFEVCNIPLGGR